KASVFIRDCSVKLDIEERILISELNKMRLQESRKHTPSRNKASSDLPPENLFDDGDPAIESQLPKTNSNDLQEHEIIRLLLHYGEMPATWLEEKNYPIAILILSSLQDVEFTDPAAKKIVTIYIEHL